MAVGVSKAVHPWCVQLVVPLHELACKAVFSQILNPQQQKRAANATSSTAVFPSWEMLGDRLTGSFSLLPCTSASCCGQQIPPGIRRASARAQLRASVP